MNPFDVHLALWFNGLTRSHALETAVVIVQNNDLIKDGPIIAALWWAWFQGDIKEPSERLQRLFSIIVFSILAVFLARGLALALPFRVRPLNAELEGFQRLSELGEHAFVRWSAFPSDNASRAWWRASGPSRGGWGCSLRRTSWCLCACHD